MNIDDATIMSIVDPSILMDKELFYAITDIKDPEERQRMSSLATIRAKTLGIEKEYAKTLRAYNKAQEEEAKRYTRENKKKGLIELDFDANGRPLTTIENFYKILSQDKHFDTLQFNELSYSPEHIVNGQTERWTDADDADAKMYIEKKYKLRSKDSYDDALRVVMRDRAYHPIRRYVESIVWDGFPRIENFLHKWTLCEDTPYTREVSRLIFAGGINRLYNPGCKYDEMPILIGTRQGEGKSTLIRFLAMKDEWFSDVREFEGQRGIESLEGAWICEVGELLALTKTKEQEAVKAFISAQNDRYRMPFDRRVTDHKRQCIMLGTTNKNTPLLDRTGNRRFHPVRVNQIGYNLFDNEDLVREDIRQCWAEALDRYKRNDNIKPFLDRKLAETAKQEQLKATEDDYRIGMIAAYLENRDKVCIPELWEIALNNTYAKPSKKESNEISLLMQSFPDWERTGKSMRFDRYGIQKGWEKKGV